MAKVAKGKGRIWWIWSENESTWKNTQCPIITTRFTEIYITLPKDRYPVCTGEHMITWVEGMTRTSVNDRFTEVPLTLLSTIYGHIASVTVWPWPVVILSSPSAVCAYCQSTITEYSYDLGYSSFQYQAIFGELNLISNPGVSDLSAVSFMRSTWTSLLDNTLAQSVTCEYRDMSQL